MKWFEQTIDAIVQHFNTNINEGLSQNQVQKKREKYGFNDLPDVSHETWLVIFLRQFKSPLIYILLIAAILIFFVGNEPRDAFIISGILFFNAIIGAIQEGRTQNIIESLKQFIKTESVVIRDGKKEIINDRELVVGDIVLLQEGQKIPADARLFESNNLTVDESILTGESVARRKITHVLKGEFSVGDRDNMVFRGTYVVAGSAKAIVVATGLNTEIGQIHTAIEEIKTDIPLRKELDRLSYGILFFIFVFCAMLFLVGIFEGRPFQELLVMLTALFICVVPEGLPVVLTLVLVSGTYRMAKKNVLVKNLQAVEALGRTDVIVIDKTGTLTRNEMLVSQICFDGQTYHVTGSGYFPEGDMFLGNELVTDIDSKNKLKDMANAAFLLNSAEITYDEQLGLFTIKGDPTEAAIFVFAQKLGVSKEELEQTYKKIYEIPFDSDLQHHAIFFEKNGRGLLYVIGSPEVIMSRSNEVRDHMKQCLNNWLQEGFRVLAVGAKEFDLTLMPDVEKMPANHFQAAKNMINDLEFLGLYGIQDSIRPEVASIIKRARDVGLKVIMATGDHIATALYVAKRVNIWQEGDTIISGKELDQLSDKQLMNALNTTTVYSRVAPQAKMRIISAFQKQEKIVAMTGDGVNDAPSLVAADLGIAMGSIGTQVAKRASDIVLLDDSFVNIISAIEEGRHIFYTLRRVILYFFATNMGEILIVLFALIANLPLPITAAQILWLNLVTDGFLDVALSMEPQERGLLALKILERKARLVDGEILAKMMFIAIPMGMVSLSLFYHYYQTDIAYARTMTLITMAMFQWFNAWNCRSERRSLFQLGFFTNKWLILATMFVLSLQFVLLHVPFMQHIFKTVPLSLHDWAIIILVSSPILIIEEIRKWVSRRIWPVVD